MGLLYCPGGFGVSRKGRPRPLRISTSSGHRQKRAPGQEGRAAALGRRGSETGGRRDFADLASGHSTRLRVVSAPGRGRAGGPHGEAGEDVRAAGRAEKAPKRRSPFGPPRGTGAPREGRHEGARFLGPCRPVPDEKGSLPRHGRNKEVWAQPWPEPPGVTPASTSPVSQHKLTAHNQGAAPPLPQAPPGGATASPQGKNQHADLTVFFSFSLDGGAPPGRQNGSRDATGLERSGRQALKVRTAWRTDSRGRVPGIKIRAVRTGGRGGGGPFQPHSDLGKGPGPHPSSLPGTRKDGCGRWFGTQGLEGRGVGDSEPAAA